MNEPRDDFLQRAKRLLDEAEQGLDGATRTRLRAARREALAAGARPSRPAWLLPAGGLAVAATVAALSVVLWQAPPPELEPLTALEDIALLSDEADPAFYEELDFYAWLAAGAPQGEDVNG